MSSGPKALNDGYISGVNPGEKHLKALYNEEKIFLPNKGGGFLSNNPMYGENKLGRESVIIVRETMIGNRASVELVGKREAGTRIHLFLPMINKIQESKGMTRESFALKIYSHALATKWKGQKRCLMR